jgi:2-keto-3-deoxy-L-rhamnonate aldolase RhmA
MCVTARLAGVVPVVRVDTASFDRVRKLLDVGAQGIIFYDVRNGDQAKTYREWITRPPEVELPAPARTPPTKQDAAALIVQIESREAVDHIRDLVTEGRPDMLQIGRGDLSHDLGAAGNMRHPLVLEAVDSIMEVAREFDVPVAAGAYSPEDAQDLFNRGIRCFHFKSDDRLLFAAYKEELAWIREVIGPGPA